MGLKINKSIKITPSLDDIMFFESDEEFTDFCIAPYAEIKEGKTFIIKDEDSQVFKRQCVCKRVPIYNNGVRVTTREDTLVQLSVKNLDEYFKEFWEK